MFAVCYSLIPTRRSLSWLLSISPWAAPSSLAQGPGSSFLFAVTWARAVRDHWADLTTAAHTTHNTYRVSHNNRPKIIAPDASGQIIDLDDDFRCGRAYNSLRLSRKHKVNLAGIIGIISDRYCDLPLSRYCVEGSRGLSCNLRQLVSWKHRK